MRKRYVVKLTQAEREQLEGLVNKGKVAAYRRKHAQVLLLVDEGKQGPAFFDKDELFGITRGTCGQWAHVWGLADPQDQVRFWIADAHNGVQNVKSAVLLLIWDKFKEAGIEIPYPQRDLHVRSGLERIVSPE